MGNINHITTTIEMPRYLQCYIKCLFMHYHDDEPYDANNGFSIKKTKIPVCKGVNQFNTFLSRVLEIRPKDLSIKDSSKFINPFTFELPTIRYKDPLYYNYVSPENNEILIAAMNIAFETSLFTYMAKGVQVDVVKGKKKLRIRHGERERLMKEFCASNKIKFSYIDVDYLAKKFTRKMEDKYDYMVFNRQLSLHFVTDVKDYESVKNKHKKNQLKINF